jgi:hypothetical protein
MMKSRRRRITRLLMIAAIMTVVLAAGAWRVSVAI